MRDIDSSWDTDEARPIAAALRVVRRVGRVDRVAKPQQAVPDLRKIRAEKGRSDDKHPLPGLPPLPDPRAVLASRILRRVRPGSVAAQLARNVMSTATQFAEELEPVKPRYRRAGTLPAPARQHVALAGRRRHGATWHIASSRRASSERLSAPSPKQRLGTPAPVGASHHRPSLELKRSFWQRMLRRRDS